MSSICARSLNSLYDLTVYKDGVLTTYTDVEALSGARAIRYKRIERRLAEPDAKFVQWKATAQQPEAELDLPYEQPGATHYDGVMDYARRSANFTGLANGKKGTMAGWVYINSDDIVESPYITLFTNAGEYLAGYLQYYPPTGWSFGVTGFGTDDAACLNVYSTNDILSNVEDLDGWHFVAASWNTETQQFSIVIDVPRARQLYSGNRNFTIAYDSLGTPSPSWFHVADSLYPSGDASLARAFPCCLAETFFHNDFIDLDVTENLRLFIDESGNPVNLGANGEIPFGEIPLYYSKQGDGVNLGTGGSMTLFGAPGACETSP